MTVGGKDMYGPVNTVGLASLLPVTHRVPTCLKSIIAPLPKALTGIVGVSLGKGTGPSGIIGLIVKSDHFRSFSARVRRQHDQWRG